MEQSSTKGKAMASTSEISRERRRGFRQLVPLLCAVRTSPSSRNNKGRSLAGPPRQTLTGEVPRMPSTVSREGDADETVKEEQAAAGKAVTKEEFQAAPAPKPPATPPEVHVPSVPTSSSLLKTEPQPGRHGHIWRPHRSGHRMGRNNN
ncbi:hypothetical protein EI555_004637 [Monodon monoceros]|uniref:Uncharacterized protein n=1 Tax=Monodon monoceros TaxID=40151 RepID=A0A4U1F779_MONMO|nr:hypothetical protein EI555_004637 [Monodon monoceros]